jgi:hypothetical protein
VTKSSTAKEQFAFTASKAYRLAKLLTAKFAKNIREGREEKRPG